MWLESEAVVTTTIVLMHNCIPSLPVHDSLLVPLAHEAKAKSYLRTNYHHVCGV
jgi:hypothetical protein